MVGISETLCDQNMKRLKRFYGDTRDFSAQQLPYFRGKLASLSELVRDIKVNPDVAIGIHLIS